jgi:hypothetical protein
MSDLAQHTKTTGSLEAGVAVAGMITLIVKQSSLEGKTALKIEFAMKSAASAAKPEIMGSLIDCWGQASPKDITDFP